MRQNPTPKKGTHVCDEVLEESVPVAVILGQTVLGEVPSEIGVMFVSKCDTDAVDRVSGVSGKKRSVRGAWHESKDSARRGWRVGHACWFPTVVQRRLWSSPTPNATIYRSKGLPYPRPTAVNGFSPSL